MPNRRKNNRKKTASISDAYDKVATEIQKAP